MTQKIICAIHKIEGKVIKQTTTIKRECYDCRKSDYISSLNRDCTCTYKEEVIYEFFCEECSNNTKKP